jgi:hypothetical protein
MIPTKITSAIAVATALLLCPMLSSANPATDKADKAAAVKKIITPPDAIGAIVFGNKGEITVVDKEGQPVPSCQLCTVEMEKIYGPRCEKASKLADLAQNKTPKPQSTAPICEKLLNTTVRNVNPMTMIEHTGSHCFTIIVAGVSRTICPPH